jgi:biopolymer transport protein ExbD
MALKTLGNASFGGSALPSLTGMEGSEVTADINVTPMIDVMLVLLIIFMVVTPALAGYTAILPKAATAAPEKEDRVTLGIDRAGRFYLDEQPGAIPLEQLAERLKTEYSVPARQDDHVLYLKADIDVGYDKVLDAINAAREAGVRRIGAITELPQGAAAAEPEG